jgi:hypothetical protein
VCGGGGGAGRLDTGRLDKQAPFIQSAVGFCYACHGGTVLRPRTACPKLIHMCATQAAAFSGCAIPSNLRKIAADRASHRSDIYTYH